MWTRGKDQNEAGKFAVQVFNDAGALVFSQGGFDTAAEADRAGELEQRNVLFGYAPGFDWNMSDDALLAELLA
jgi:hypothetical protein